MGETKPTKKELEKREQDAMRIGKEMAFARKSNKATQQDVADKLGVSRPYISKIENGQTIIPEYVLKFYCETFNVSPETLLLTGIHYDLTENGKRIESALPGLPDRLLTYILGIIDMYKSK